MSKIIIAISGWKGSGKDTAANYLIESFNFKRLGFADPLKDNVASEYGIPRTDLDDQSKKEKPILSMPVECSDKFTTNVNTFMYREFVNKNGVHPSHAEIVDGKLLGIFDNAEGEKLYMPLYHCPRSLAILEGSTKRCANVNHWVEQAVRKTENNGLYVISDMRYKSEAKALERACGGRDLFLTLRINRFETTESQDPSERDLDNYKFDTVIDNKGDIFDLKNSIDSVISAVLGGK